MINVEELRIGNTILYKAAVRILPVTLTLQHFEMIAKNGTKDFFPVVLKADVLQQQGFTENKKYPGLPAAREFSRLLPVPGPLTLELFAWIKSNGECFGRAVLEGKAISQNFYHLHQLENLYSALTGEKLE